MLSIPMKISNSEMTLVSRPDGTVTIRRRMRMYLWFLCNMAQAIFTNTILFLCSIQ